MSIEHRHGSLFDLPDVEAVAHGCNCAGAMGAGIAVEFRRRWPEMFEEYRRRCREGQFQLGDVFPWESDHLTIYNLATQRTWRARAELSAIEKAVRGMLRHAEGHGIGRVGMPRLGAGLGRLPWPDVERTLREAVADSGVHIVVAELVP